VRNVNIDKIIIEIFEYENLLIFFAVNFAS